MKNILLVEDSASMAEAYMAYLKRGGYAPCHAATATDALAILTNGPIDAVVLDIHLPDGNGIDMLRDIRARSPDLPVIMITADTSVDQAVTAMRLGAYDFITKPFSAERLNVTLGNALERKLLRAELQAAEGDGFGPFIGRSAGMQAVYRILRHVAESRAPVFVTGESGTGKELAAQCLHRHSARRTGPFRAINCAAIPEQLLESELFGHVRGAFTGAAADRMGLIPAAHGGTLFLDEICDMPSELQVKLLRVIQTGTVQPVGSNKTINVDVRFVAATNRNVTEEVRAGRFREDLYYRLYVVPLELPPLRARGSDVGLLADAFLARYAEEEGKRFTGFAPLAVQFMNLYPWPGNVRQLENSIRYAVAMKDGGAIDLADLPPQVTEDTHSAVTPLPVTNEHTATALPESCVMPLWQLEKQAIHAALASTGNDVPRAAALLQVNPSTIYRKLQTWAKQATTA